MSNRWTAMVGRTMAEGSKVYTEVHDEQVISVVHELSDWDNTKAEFFPEGWDAHPNFRPRECVHIP
jgi:hypothetical protein